MQTPALHVLPIGQTVAQLPQCAGSVRVSTSQPFAAFMSQSANGPEHVKVHAPAVDRLGSAFRSRNGRPTAPADEKCERAVDVRH